MSINIVLDGPKACGKSTIANMIINELGNWKYIHSDSQTKNDLEYHLGLLNQGENTVLDRFSFGEVVYSKVYDRKCKLTPSEFLETVTRENTIYVVLYSSSMILLEERMVRRGRKTEDEELSLVSSSNSWFIRCATWMQDQPCSVRKRYLTFDVAKYTAEEIFEKIKEKMEEF